MVDYDLILIIVLVRDGNWTRGYPYPRFSYLMDMDMGKNSPVGLVESDTRNVSSMVRIVYFTHGYPVDTLNINSHIMLFVFRPMKPKPTENPKAEHTQTPCPQLPIHICQPPLR
jgi:hypothetical protein